MRITSAPICAIVMPPSGAATKADSSTIRKSCSKLFIPASCLAPELAAEGRRSASDRLLKATESARHCGLFDSHGICPSIGLRGGDVRLPKPIVETNRNRVVARLVREGWTVRHGGDHDVYKHQSQPGRI